MSALRERQPCRGMQLGAGLFLTGLTTDEASDDTLPARLREAIADDDRVLGATAPGGSFSAMPKYTDYGAGQDPELLMLTGWTVLLTGTLLECSPRALAALLGPADITVNGAVTSVRARAALRQGDAVPDLCWVGPTTGGLVVIALRNALSCDGVTFTFGEDSGTAPFRFRACGAGEDGAPFRLIFVKEDDDAAD